MRIGRGVVLVIAVLALPGCGGDGQKAADPPAGLTAIGAGAGADPSVAGTLEASEAQGVDAPFDQLDIAGRTIAIDATRQPAGPVTVSLPLTEPPGDDQVLLVATAASPEGPWELVPGRLSEDGRSVLFETPHFSWFTPLLFDLKQIFGGIKDLIDGVTSGATAEAKQPRCTDEQPAREGGWKASSTGPDTLKWCFGIEDGARIARIVNARRYALVVDHPGGRLIESPTQDWHAWLSQRVSAKATILPPRERATYSVAGNATFRTEFDGLANSLSQLEVGVETAVAIWTRLGADKKGLVGKLSDVFDSGKCLGALQHTDNGGTVIQRCLGDAKQLGDALGWKGVALAAVMTSSSLVEFFRSELNALGDQLNGRDKYTLRIRYAAPPVLGVEDLVINGEGWGEVEPSIVFNGGVPSGLIDELTWTAWGSAVASGRGVIAIYRPEGGYYSERVPIDVRALGLGTCPGSDDPRYTRMIVRYPSFPGGEMGPWHPWTLSLCDWDQEPDDCGQVGYEENSDYGVFDITAWDVGCDEARDVATEVGHANLEGQAGDPFSASSHDFACEGYDFDEPLPTISWSCYRGTAVVSFDRS
jgi:hypothetical protein